MDIVNDNRRIEDNISLSFQLESSNLRGRVVRLGETLDSILTGHDYPDAISVLTGEMTVIAALLSSMLKYDGVFTLQAQGDGPVRMAVADMTTDGDVRACAAFREGAAGEGASPAALLGDGHMAFTVDQGDFTDRYQGIVALDPTSLIGSIRNYFTQSEQIGTAMAISVGRIDGRWRGGGIMLQQMPEDAARYNADEPGGTGRADEEGWVRATTLLASVKPEELTSRDLGADDLLYRLFHEEGVRVFPAKHLRKACRCNPDRVRRILESMSDADRADMEIGGKITMTCEFCSTEYVFSPDEFTTGATT